KSYETREVRFSSPFMGRRRQSRRRGRVASARRAPVPGVRIAQLLELGHRLGSVPDPVQDVHPVPVEHRLTERFPTLVLLPLQVDAGQLPDQDLERALPRAPLTIRMLQAIKARQQLATEL